MVAAAFKMLDTTTVSKFKPNGDCRGRVVVQGFKQKEGTQHNKDDLAASAINSMAIWICLVLMTVVDSHGHIVNVEGDFLTGRHKNGEQIPIDVPEPFGKWCPSHVLL